MVTTIGSGARVPPADADRLLGPASGAPQPAALRLFLPPSRATAERASEVVDYMYQQHGTAAAGIASGPPR